jgi:hypothetical protein
MKEFLQKTPYAPKSEKHEKWGMRTISSKRLLHLAIAHYWYYSNLLVRRIPVSHENRG